MKSLIKVLTVTVLTSTALFSSNIPEAPKSFPKCEFVSYLIQSMDYFVSLDTSQNVVCVLFGYKDVCQKNKRKKR